MVWVGALGLLWHSNALVDTGCTALYGFRSLAAHKRKVRRTIRSPSAVRHGRARGTRLSRLPRACALSISGGVPVHAAGADCAVLHVLPPLQEAVQAGPGLSAVAAAAALAVRRVLRHAGLAERANGQDAISAAAHHPHRRPPGARLLVHLHHPRGVRGHSLFLGHAPQQEPAALSRADHRAAHAGAQRQPWVGSLGGEG